MQRPITKQSPGPNAAEKRFIAWTKERDCICCDAPGPSIAHHCYGSTRKERVGIVSVQIGNLAVIPLCQRCDEIVTNQSRRVFINAFGPQCHLWVKHAKAYPDVYELDLLKCIAIAGCGE